MVFSLYNSGEDRAQMMLFEFYSKSYYTISAK